MKVTLINYTPNPEQAIIDAAAVCWQSTPREQILHHIIKAGHWTPLEFAGFNFRVQGVSRALTHQLVRKRVGVAFCQESQRYVDYKNNCDFVAPPSIVCDAEATQIYNAALYRAWETYEQLRNLDIPPEDARFVLPNACESTISMSINYHALIDLCKERLCSRAQWEIRAMVAEMKKEVEKISPTLAGYLQPKCYWLKNCPEAKGCGLHAHSR